jgi:hypothetical protein
MGNNPSLSKSWPGLSWSSGNATLTVRPRQVKLFYERVLGGGTLATARVTRDGPAWQRTEVWA